MNDPMYFSADDFIDVIQGNRVYLKCLYVGNINLLCYPNKLLLARDALYDSVLAFLCANF